MKQQTCSCTKGEVYACANKVLPEDIVKLRDEYWYLAAKQKYLFIKRKMIADMIRNPDQTIDFKYAIGTARVCGPFSGNLSLCVRKHCALFELNFWLANFILIHIHRKLKVPSRKPNS
jgi:hypothetical protein